MVLDLLFIGLVITLYPLPIAAFVVVVSAPLGLRKGLAFILAWLTCLVAVIAIVLLLTDGQPPPPRSPTSTSVLVVKLALGLGLIVYSERKRRQRRRTAAHNSAADEKPVASKSPKSSRMDNITVWSAASLAVLLQPWGMVGVAATTVVTADLAHAQSFLALLAFCVLATSSLLTMELYMVFAPQRAQQALADLRAWLERHKEQAIVVTCLVLGLWTVGRSLYELTA
ncbi:MULTISPECIES: GAP family protein [unclassified Kitasatospora]|uniref:GAP family protein n=1 Tax=unclassified Kitasatospora TaxID=2633591 RepID=UPI000710746D|nr:MULTISPECIES: GAP family protein [unclassified Kitasatospora]KQV14283.1 hypothetical protein ASC99_31950 [Kitasatospora sp. Root107]KRB72383.1 hypothetical protein ASE03_22955 [Kitasatospora sp. Root187]